MKKIILTIIFLFTNLVFSQETHHTKDTTTISEVKKVQQNIYSYMDIKMYKKMFGSKLTKSDSLNFKYVNKDTLVMIKDPNYNRKVTFKTVNFEYKDSTFLKLYKKVAFNKNFKDENGLVTLKYWKEKIKIYFSPSIPMKTKKNFMNFTKDISKGVDSLQISEVKNINDSNYVIYQNDDFEFSNNLKKATASDYYINWAFNQINQGYLKMNIGQQFNEKLYEEKLMELFVLSLGYFTKTDLIDCRNFFSTCYSENKQMTTLDREILKYHYSYGIDKGVDEATFDLIHKKANEKKRINPNVPVKVSHQITKSFKVKIPD